ncbi:MAG TPA: hypothetical protein PK264_18520 [Hyphomicrobiaceae bacterium]|nr:hypothetical protein [Hyphomicrobiaceae bacterium]
MTEAQLRHLIDDPLPAGVYDAAEAAIVRYAQKSTRLEQIDAQTYSALERHFSPAQIVDICLTVGLSNMVNRFHLTFLTEVDASTTAAAEAGDASAGACLCLEHAVSAWLERAASRRVARWLETRHGGIPFADAMRFAALAGGGELFL